MFASRTRESVHRMSGNALPSSGGLTLFKPDSHGFTLISALIGLTLVSGIALSLTQVIGMGVKGSAGVAQRVHFSLILSNLIPVVTRETSCGDAFLKTDGTPAKFPGTLPEDRVAQIQHKVGSGPGHVMLKEGDFVEGLRIENIDMQPTSGLSPSVNFPEPGKTTHYVDLTVTATKVVNSYGGQIVSNQEQPFKIAIVTDAITQVIEDCMSTGSQWEAVSLVSLDPFDPNCRYRFRISPTSFDTYSTSGSWFHASGVSPSILTFVVHAGYASHINSDSKNSYRVSDPGSAFAGGPFSSVTALQERCD